MKKEITLEQLKDALISAFHSYSWDTTDYDVWVGIREFFAERTWRALDGEELMKEGKLRKQPSRYKHIIWNYYKRVDSSI